MGTRTLLERTVHRDHILLARSYKHINHDLLLPLLNGQVLGKGAVSPLDEHPLGTEALEAARHGLEVRHGANLALSMLAALGLGEDEVGLGDVGGQDGGVGEEVGDELLDGFLREQPGSR